MERLLGIVERAKWALEKCKRSFSNTVLSRVRLEGLVAILATTVRSEDHGKQLIRKAINASGNARLEQGKAEYQLSLAEGGVERNRSRIERLTDLVSRIKNSILEPKLSIVRSMTFDLVKRARRAAARLAKVTSAVSDSVLEVELWRGICALYSELRSGTRYSSIWGFTR